MAKYEIRLKTETEEIPAAPKQFTGIDVVEVLMNSDGTQLDVVFNVYSDPAIYRGDSVLRITRSIEITNVPSGKCVLAPSLESSEAASEVNPDMSNYLDNLVDELLASVKAEYGISDDQPEEPVIPPS